MLRFEAQGVVNLSQLAAFTLDRAIEEVACIELNPRLIRVDFQHAPARRFLHPRRHAYLRTRTIQYPVMVVTMAQLQLLVLIVDARAGRGGIAEIERRAGDRNQLARRNQAGIHRRIAVRVDGQQIAQNP